MKGMRARPTLVLATPGPGELPLGETVASPGPDHTARTARLRVLMGVRCPPEGPGGVERVVSELTTELAVLRPTWEVQAVAGLPYPTRARRIPLVGDLVAAARMGRTAISVPYDVFIVHGAEYAWAPLAVNWFRRRPVVVVWHGVRSQEAQGYRAASRSVAVLQQMFFAIERCLQGLALSADAIVVVGPMVAEQIRNDYGYGGTVAIIPNGVRLKTNNGWRSRPGTDRPLSDGACLRVLWVGTGSQPYGTKGLDVAMEACRLARQAGTDLTLDVVGFDRLPPGCPGFEDATWINWHGRLPPGQMQERYGRADILLASTRYEACSMVLLEAFASGLPVLGSPAVTWMVGDGGLSMEDWSPVSFAAALGDLGRDSKLREKLRRRALARAGQFRWDVTASRYAELLEATTAIGVSGRGVHVETSPAAESTGLDSR